jgi:hypothetical protein
MRPLHIVLLVVGAALAGGLAVKMTQAPPLPVVAPLVQPARPPVSQMAVRVPVAKPSPLPEIAPPVRAQVSATAPEPVYEEPVHGEPAKPAIRQSKRVLMVKVTNPKPTQWTPGPYEASATAARPPAAVAPPQPVAQVLTPPAPVPAPRQVTLETGMTIPIRLNESLTSERTVTGGPFEASLVEPFVVDGLVIAERGARVTGHIVNSAKARVELGLATMATSDGQQVAISTDPWTRLIGSGDALGAGTVIRFRLASRVTVTEQQIAGR